MTASTDLPIGTAARTRATLGCVSALTCTYCGRENDADDPAVGEGPNWDRDGEITAYWIPWIADLRGGPMHLYHPVCYAELRGVERLIDLVVVSERRRRS